MRRPDYAPNKYRTHNLPSAADLDKSLDEWVNEPVPADDRRPDRASPSPWKSLAAAAAQTARVFRILTAASLQALAFVFNAAEKLLRKLAAAKRKPRRLSTVNARSLAPVTDQRLSRQPRQPATPRTQTISRPRKTSPPRNSPAAPESERSASGIYLLVAVGAVAVLLLGWQAISSMAPARPTSSPTAKTVSGLSVAGPVSHDPDHAVFNIPLKVTFAHQADEGPLDPAIINKVRFSYGKGELIENHPLQVVVIDSSDAPEIWMLMFTFPDSVAGEQITLRATLKGISTDVQLLFIQLTSSATE